jgi:hypothetical protein
MVFPLVVTKLMFVTVYDTVFPYLHGILAVYDVVSPNCEYSSQCKCDYSRFGRVLYKA